jgi:RHH-type transcriptional regulator, proline utilization regulon repressor / proline dehydrogenase / delta 1-pyrroline-5-carboxylate dehydrogenase
MLTSPNALNPIRQQARLPQPGRDENAVLANILPALQPALPWTPVLTRARPWVQAVRDNPAPFWAMESLLREYPISSAEGLALMRLAEALLRVPDTATAIALTADQLGRAQFDGSQSSGTGPHKLLASLSANAIALSKKFLPDTPNTQTPGLFQRLGSQTVVAATVRAIELMGRQFVLGRDMGEALREAAGARKKQNGLCFSYDMLGEGARTEADAVRYLSAYSGAIDAIAGGQTGRGPQHSDGISIKLSALFTRYEEAQSERVFSDLLPRVWSLIEVAAKANINLTIDAEESDRLELSLDVFERLAQQIAQHFPKWSGFGLAVQAYQTRALEVIHEVARIGKKHGLGLMVRLVKGAYWDGEIKRAQELGLQGYPVYTHKHHTDISYLACAQTLLAYAPKKGAPIAAGNIYPQFATHNAATIAAVLNLADAQGAAFELQRLHGMGEGVYREVMREVSVPVRVYAPVGQHRDLLAYLVRRLLENGANSSFVHQLSDEAVDIDVLLASPLQASSDAGVPLSLAMFADRRNAAGVDLTNLHERLPLEAAVTQTVVAEVPVSSIDQVHAAMQMLSVGFNSWNTTAVSDRAAILRRAADMLEARMPEFCGLLVKEAHKTMGDCVAEVREAVDFFRYYAVQAESLKNDFPAPGPQGLGVFVCISPWNFPLAIFAGQVAAALVTGNTVAAKPAEQTPHVAERLVALLHEAGLPRDALVMLHGPGETIGATLVAHPSTAGVCFTGSTAVAHIINRSLAARMSATPPVLIAETGGINAMVMDSSALPEQVVDAVVQSAFRSAGQRCSALRLLCVHEGVADAVIDMVRGALLELNVGDPALFATDVGPVIDDEAFNGIRAHIARLRKEARWLGEAPVTANTPRLIAPIAFELDHISDMRQEIFGPVLHVVRWSGEPEAVIAQINALGYGLTLGIQTRIDSRALQLAAQARVGNVYINRNMIGAVVGVQPFGGEGLSGTGPKAGGPHYLYRFCADGAQTTSVAASAVTGTDSKVMPQPAIADLMQSLHQGHLHWSGQTVATRVALLERAAALLSPTQHPQTIADWTCLAQQAQRRLSVHPLPGPTGEKNELHLHGRGLFAILATANANPRTLAQQLAAALLAGNTVVWIGPQQANAQAWMASLQQAGLPPTALAAWPCEPGQLDAVLGCTELAGVALDDAADVGKLSHQLAARTGAILPLVSGGVAQENPTGSALGRLLLRFVAEQTVTVNTAAAGGNVELLARAATAG